MIKLNNFSLLNAPPLSQAKETLEMMNHFPETLGHCIVYLPPRVFSGMWSFAQNMIDVRYVTWPVHDIVFTNSVWCMA